MMNKLNKTILLADDDFDYLFLVKFKLEAAGFNTISADSQKDAEKLVTSIKYDAAVFDLMMENDDSGFVLAYLSKKTNPEVPVVITTAVAAETGMSFDNDSSWVKADLYLEKGVQAERLADELKRLLKIL